MAAPRTTTSNTLHGKNKTLAETIFSESFKPILGTSRHKTTTGREKRRDNDAIEHNYPYGNLAGNALDEYYGFIVVCPHREIQPVSNS